jgi:hypothetical protein
MLVVGGVAQVRRTDRDGNWGPKNVQVRGSLVVTASLQHVVAAGAAGVVVVVVGVVGGAVVGGVVVVAVVVGGGGSIVVVVVDVEREAAAVSHVAGVLAAA